MMNSGLWYEGIGSCERAGCAYILITLISTSGSTPRDPGCKMVVSDTDVFDTIGGGQFEFLLIQRARELLHVGDETSDGSSHQLQMSTQWVEAFPLAAEAKQCCGGNVSVLFELFNPVQWRLAIFGAGHVARHIVSIMQELSCRISWIDNREDFFPETHSQRVNQVYINSSENASTAVRKHRYYYINA